MPKISSFIILAVGFDHSNDFPKMVQLHTVQHLLYFYIYSQCSIAEDTEENCGKFSSTSETLCYERKKILNPALNMFNSVRPIKICHGA